MWFDIIGVTLGFVSSVIFSAGLIKPKEQIRDENTTYFNANFYTLNAAMGSRTYLIIAFVLLIAGFATSLGGLLGEFFGNGNLLISFLFTVSLIFFGLLGTALFYLQRIAAHNKMKSAHAKTVFLGAIRNHKNSLRNLMNNSTQNKDELFKAQKSSIINQLEKLAQPLVKSESEREKQLVDDLQLCNDPSEMHEILDEFIETYKS